MAVAIIETLPAYAVIIRAVHERGETQHEALRELRRRGLWLSAEQRDQAGLPAVAHHRMWEMLKRFNADDESGGGER